MICRDDAPAAGAVGALTRIHFLSLLVACWQMTGYDLHGLFNRTLACLELCLAGVYISLVNFCKLFFYGVQSVGHRDTDPILI